ncbi:Nucleolar protein 14 [Sesbania bispinosa]|nr:Nucleolar protein 14 [Sesbania bispinosa]
MLVSAGCCSTFGSSLWNVIRAARDQTLCATWRDHQNSKPVVALYEARNSLQVKRLQRPTTLSSRSGHGGNSTSSARSARERPDAWAGPFSRHQKRKNTLLKEYEQSTKSSLFVDKRIGEKDEALDEFGKAILRSQRERQLNVKLSKKSKYHLSDGEEDDFEGLMLLEGMISRMNAC